MTRLPISLLLGLVCCVGCSSTNWKARYMDKEREAGEMSADLERSRHDVAVLQADNRVQADRLSRSGSEADGLRRTIGDLEADVDALRESAASEVASANPTVDLDEIRRKTGVDDVRRNEKGDLVITLEGGVTFSSGSAKLTVAGRKTLERVASAIRTEFPGRLIRVEGHTDSDPIRRSRSKFEDNWDLGFKRARAVAVYFRDRASIDPESLLLASRGEYAPLESNKNDKGKRRNRRVEIIVELPVRHAATMSAR